MKSTEQFEATLGNIKIQRERIKKCCEQIKKAQKEIGFLSEKSVHDPQAQRKLAQLAAAYPDNFKKEKEQLETFAKDIRNQVKQFNTKIKNIQL